ncbi:hypothetical protein AUR67_00455 [Pseudoalteromonas sp. XI10]|uniref:hypothetical protein n=1 Tax=Pseudoalteromonas sp. XI10 TaxID=1766621 RepID=UPI0007335BC4|nr:hypothetical protein [Pseudoalteromonas sp. XI10]KTG21983.1 hypothetical protein AUR67_00455 [Pseudoalteromonas sp. XI10]
MKVSVDGMRRNMTDDLTRLREAILSITDNLYQDDKQEIIDSFDQVACNQNSFNCMYDDENPSFNDLRDSCEVELIGDYD